MFWVEHICSGAEALQQNTRGGRTNILAWWVKSTKLECSGLFGSKKKCMNVRQKLGTRNVLMFQCSEQLLFSCVSSKVSTICNSVSLDVIELVPS